MFVDVHSQIASTTFVEFTAMPGRARAGYNRLQGLLAVQAVIED
jgi:hypothetical protein